MWRPPHAALATFLACVPAAAPSPRARRTSDGWVAALRAVVLAHSNVAVASGNHRAENHRPANRPPVLVHHFKVV
ncbi:hypothetical protein GCM10027072_09860 [Streptomyces bullii]